MAVIGATIGASSDHLDAGVLLMPIMGFLPADDERMATTIDAIEHDGPRSTGPARPAAR